MVMFAVRLQERSLRTTKGVLCGAHFCSVFVPAWCYVEMMDDTTLLDRYVRNADESAFREFVNRHLDFVYSAALRQVNGDAASAQDVAQAVFTDVARKARSLANHPTLAGWLFTSTRYAATKLVRRESLRRNREQKASAMQKILQQTGSEPRWDEIRPVLDATLAELKPAEREAVLLRFFESYPYADISAKLRITEDAARMRVERALDQLRTRLARRGVTSTSAALAGVLTQNVVTAAPPAVATAIASGALASATLGVGVTTILFMNTKTIIAVASTSLALAAAVYEFQQVRDLRREVVSISQERDLSHRQARVLEQRVAAADRRSADLQKQVSATIAQKSEPSSRTITFTAADGKNGIVTGGGTLTLSRASSDPAQARAENRARVERVVDSTYAALFRQLGWTAEQQRQFRSLMADEDERYRDLFHSAVAAARAQNPQIDRAGMFEVLEATQAQMQQAQHDAVRRAMGDSVATALEHFDAIASVRPIATDLAGALFNSNAPIDAPLADRVVEVLARHATGALGKADVLALDSEAALADIRNQNLLNGEQVTALQRSIAQVQERVKAERERNTASAGSVLIMKKPSDITVERR